MKSSNGRGRQFGAKLKVACEEQPSHCPTSLALASDDERATIRTVESSCDDI